MKIPLLLLTAFVTNGISYTLMKSADIYNLQNHIYSIILIWSITAMLASVVFMLIDKSKFEKKNMQIGAMAGMSSIIGVVFQMFAIMHLPSYVLFPIVSGVQLIAISVAGVAVFQEKVGIYGIIGIISAIIAVILLSVA